MSQFNNAELILNPDGSIYHLNLLPQDIAPIVITVGDPDRVDMITQYFDSIRVTKQKREFKTQTGTYKGTNITVISTGIGTDNIDIVLNELDALVNIDFGTRKIKNDLTQLKIIRLGTSGAIQPNIALDSFLISKNAIGFDSVFHYYQNDDPGAYDAQQAFVNHMEWDSEKGMPYICDASSTLLNHFTDPTFIHGFTATNVGFYGPQGRQLRADLKDRGHNEKLRTFNYQGLQITNLEMETSAIYALANCLGHQAISINAILANRALGTFSLNPQETVSRMIVKSLDSIQSL